MASTYDRTRLDLPLNSIRLVLQDVGPTEWLLDDAEILAYAPGGVLAQSTSTLAAASLAELLATRFIAVDISEGGASASLSQLAPQYAALAKRLRSGSMTAPTLPTDECSYGPAFTRQSGDPSIAWTAETCS